MAEITFTGGKYFREKLCALVELVILSSRSSVVDEA